jgi:short-subunit dehydrogenase
MRNKNFAMITGASEGFGKALALECAGRGMNLVLVALPGSGLSQLTCFIERNFSVTVYSYEHDLSRKEECQLLFGEILKRKIPVNILINNAGIGNTGFFEEKDADFYHRQIELNVVAPTLLTHYFLRTLEENTPAHILNVSSLAGFFSLPKKVVYGGTKSYLLSFSKSLRKELKEKNVFVSTICPGGMNTTPMLILQNKNQSCIGRWSIMNPEEVAKVAIGKMLDKKEVIIPGFWNRFVMLLDKLLPTRIKELLTERTMKRAKPIYNPSIIPINTLKKAI